MPQRLNRKTFTSFSVFFALTLLISTEQPNFERPDLDEELYRKMLLQSDNLTVKSDYLKKYGDFIVDEGLSLIEIRNMPVIEELNCADPQNGGGAEFFFKNGKLCSRSVSLFPSRKVFTLKSESQIASMDPNWRTISGFGMKLFYNSHEKFVENQDNSGKILKKTDDGGFVSSIGKPTHPFFIFEKGEWRAVYPLRELFDFKMQKDGSFKIKMVAESPISYESEKLIETIDLKADEIKVKTALPSNYEIEGKNLKGVKFPQLISLKNSGSYHGVYKILLSYPKLKQKIKKEFKNESYKIEIGGDSGRLEFVLTVFKRELQNDEISAIEATLRKEVPPFFVDRGGDDG